MGLGMLTQEKIPQDPSMDSYWSLIACLVLSFLEVITCSREVNSSCYLEVAGKKRLSTRLSTPVCNEHSAQSFTLTSTITRQSPDVFQGTLQMTTALKMSTVSPNFPFPQRVPELCSITICIIHFDGKILALHLCSLLYLKITKGLFPAPRRLPGGDYQRKGAGFQVRTLRLCYRLVPGEAALGGSARGKLPSMKYRVRGRGASWLGWHSRIPKLLTFGGIWKDKGRASKILLWWLPTY